LADPLRIIQSIDCNDSLGSLDDPIPPTRAVANALTDSDTSSAERPLHVELTHGDIKVATPRPTVIALARVEQTGFRPEQVGNLVNQISFGPRGSWLDRGTLITRGQ
jgi:hypothetical protein